MCPGENIAFLKVINSLIFNNQKEEDALHMTQATTCAICVACFNKAGELGQPCQDALVIACDENSLEQIAKINSKNDISIVLPAIEILEKFGYLKTMEISKEEIAFIPTCKVYKLKSGHSAYCWCPDGN